MYLGIRKNKISEPKVLEDIIINTEDLLYKDYGTPVENLIKSYLFTDKVNVLKSILNNLSDIDFKKENINYKSIYSLTDVHKLDFHFVENYLIIWPLKSNNY